MIRSKEYQHMMGSVFMCLLVATFFLEVDSHWIDPDTPMEARVTKPLLGSCSSANNITHLFNPSKVLDVNETDLVDKSIDCTLMENVPEYSLVMSDEFNVPGRTFRDGEDPKWTALEKNDYTNDALHYYTEENVFTNDEGHLEIITELKDTEVIGFDDVHRIHSRLTKRFRSGMLQSWNKFCMVGGIFEAEVMLPGYSDVSGLWPALWLLGNLSRHTYIGSSNHMWPWSFDRCNEVYSPAQRINGCQSANHFGLKSELGRGSPEIDILEVQPGPMGPNTGKFEQTYVGQPFMSASLQISPGKNYTRAGNGVWPTAGEWYENIEFGRDTCINIYYYGTWNFFRSEYSKEENYWSDAVSWNRQLGETHFNSFHKYRLEWEPPALDNSDEGHLAWYLDDELVLHIPGDAIHNVTEARLAYEPMSILINTAVSSQWGFPLPCPTGCCTDFNCRSDIASDKCGFPDFFCNMMETKKIVYKVNYVRVYQNKNNPKHKVTCSPPEAPTRTYIEAHKHLYMKAGDSKPLKQIQKGGAVCGKEDSVLECGGSERGFCDRKNRCSCLDYWTGPKCLVPEGSDPFIYDIPQTLSDIGYRGPSFVLGLFTATMLILFCVASFFASKRCNRKVNDWFTYRKRPSEASLLNLALEDLNDNQFLANNTDFDDSLLNNDDKETDKLMF